ncbi:Hypothetical predicted protein [Lecanosticta acicola]|uniref:F-box domain-containing protein n=1 Tax=Lecanosticta acicola TaxID=111012 RepID=A0AAI8Z6F7_9PEZI|nr:Hypothetical predicted protein [Lecanosticta acicola]
MLDQAPFRLLHLPVELQCYILQHALDCLTATIHLACRSDCTVHPSRSQRPSALPTLQIFHNLRLTNQTLRKLAQDVFYDVNQFTFWPFAMPPNLGPAEGRACRLKGVRHLIFEQDPVHMTFRKTRLAIQFRRLKTGWECSCGPDEEMIQRCWPQDVHDHNHHDRLSLAFTTVAFQDPWVMSPSCDNPEDAERQSHLLKDLRPQEQKLGLVTSLALVMGERFEMLLREKGRGEDLTLGDLKRLREIMVGYFDTVPFEIWLPGGGGGGGHGEGEGNYIASMRYVFEQVPLLRFIGDDKA